MKLDPSHESHLVINEFSVPAGGEWAPQLAGWSVLQIRKGAGYHLLHQTNQALEAGSVLLVADGAKGRIRASQLGALSVHAFSVMPARLTGLMTLYEQESLDLAASGKAPFIRILPPLHPVALNMKELYACGKREGLQFRLKLIQIFADAFRNELELTVGSGNSHSKINGDLSDVKQRLETILKQAPASELLEMNFNELARRAHCTPRHLSRIFYQLVGMSFREKRAELRLARARELLANGNSKVVDVALESGYKSLSLFNLMFARRYGTSPGKWRQKNGSQKKLVAVNFRRARGCKN